MEDTDLPVIRLRLRPHFGPSSGEASHLSVKYTLPQPTSPDSHAVAATAADSLAPWELHYETFYGNVPSHPYQPDDIRACDEHGRLDLEFVRKGEGEHERSVQVWRPAENGRGFVGGGAVTLEMDVWPREVDVSTPLGARVDMRKDQGGLQAAGRWFLPKLVPGNTSTTTANTMFTNIVEWDLAEAPLATRAVWSHGEGPDPVSIAGPADTTLNTIYMVGPVRSHPPAPHPGTSPGFSACYWFGDALPANLDRLKGFNTALFGPMARMFEDGVGGAGGEGVQSAYRVFMRRAPRGYGGTGFRESYVLEYDGSSGGEPDDGVRQLFAHEMVHSFALMDQEEDGEENAWFTEGIAEFYACILPHRLGVLPASYLTDAVTAKLSAYLTNPAVNMPIQDAQRNFFSNWYAEHVPYHRGFAYFVRVDAQLRIAAGVAVDADDDALQPGPLDQIVVELFRRREKGDTIRKADWLRALGTWLDGTGVDYVGELEGILAGDTVPLADVFVGSRRNMLVPSKSRVLQYGFDRAALNSRVVKEVVPGSNAEKAGLRVGDKIVANLRGGRAIEEEHMVYWLEVKREGSDEVKRIEWLPREDRTVTVYKLDEFRR